LVPNKKKTKNHNNPGEYGHAQVLRQRQQRHGDQQPAAYQIRGDQHRPTSGPVHQDAGHEPEQQVRQPPRGVDHSHAARALVQRDDHEHLDGERRDVAAEAGHR